ncbi:MAG TPA: FAD-binding oxidoreductase, partial [Gemmatimonadales bacterium]|nr:FAD-binding oxidoreductase [Gemmatimonadales bacterium]
MTRLSWGGYPRVNHRGVVPLRSVGEPLPQLSGCVLPHAWGRSYGDSCLNADGWLLDITRLDRIIEFNAETGHLHVEAGVTLAAILDRVVPLGWFLPVVPGTKWVSVGGAIANDIHGKNHHGAGTFGCHVTEFELLRSSGERLRCSAEANRELYGATIGGLGLTGVIVTATLQLQPIPGPAIAMERIRYGSLAEFLALAADDANYQYTVAWVDALARGQKLGRGLYLRGRHVAAPGGPAGSHPGLLSVPFDLPVGLLTPLVAR